jgi:hypothetical protein
VIQTAIDPSPLVKLGPLISQAMKQSEADRRREAAELSTADRRRILESYFAQAYRVAPLTVGIADAVLRC